MTNQSTLLAAAILLIVTFTIPVSGQSKSERTYTDPRDQNVYKITQIGDLFWFEENLQFKTHTSICYDSLDVNCEKYGRLYAMDEASSICPEFWRLPTPQDVDGLHEIMGTNKIDKIAAPDEWDVKKAEKFNNELGLSMLPAGRIDSIHYFSHETNSWLETVTFHQKGIAASFWLEDNETENGLMHWHIGEPMGERKSGMHRHHIIPEIHKFSVRCVCEKERIKR